jgi:hypothetical protein
MSDHSRDDAMQVAEQFKTDLEQITKYLQALKKYNLREGQEIQVRFFSEVFSDTVLTSESGTELEIKEINHHCNHYGCEEMLEIYVQTISKASQGQLGIDNITWNYDNETDELTPYFGAVITYIDKSRWNARKERDDFSLSDEMYDMVFKELHVMDIPFRRTWLEDTTLQPVLDYLKTDEFNNLIQLLSSVTHNQVIN